MVSKTLKKIGVFIIIVILLIGIGLITGILGTPTAGIEDIGDWGKVSENQTEIITTLWVENPNPVGISLREKEVKASYSLYLNKLNLANGGKKGIQIKSGRNNVQLSTFLKNKKLPEWWVRYINKNETIPVRAESSVNISSFISKSIDIPTQKRTLLENSTPFITSMSEAASGLEGKYPSIAPQIIIKEGWASWGEVNKNNTKIEFHFLLYNPNPYPVPMVPENFGANIDLNKIRMMEFKGDSFSLKDIDSNAVIMPEQTKKLNFTVDMDNKKIDKWFTSHVKKDERTDIDVQLQLLFKIQDNTYKIPSNGGIRYSCMIQTSILVDDMKTSTTCGKGGTLGVSKNILNTSLSDNKGLLDDGNISNNNVKEAKEKIEDSTKDTIENESTINNTTDSNESIIDNVTDGVQNITNDTENTTDLY